MPRFHRDEVTKLEDIEALLVTARDLADRFQLSQLKDTALSIRQTLAQLRSAKAQLVKEWRILDNPAVENEPDATSFDNDKQSY